MLGALGSSWLIAMVVGQTAALVAATGPVDIAPPGAEYRAGKLDEPLAPGTRVRTGVAGEAALKLADGTLVKLRERSQMAVAVKNVMSEKRAAIVLFFGRLWSKVAKSEARFEVATPNAVAGVRGTEFTTAVGEDGESKVLVSEGEVAVENDQKQVTVQAGQGVDAGADKVSAPGRAKEPNWNKWRDERRSNLQKNGESIARGMKSRIDERNAEVTRLLAEQRRLKAEAQDATPERRTELKAELEKNAARLADLGVRMEGQFGAFDHWGELARDPEFGAKFFGAGFIKDELGRLNKLRENLQRMIAEGTDLSMKSMEQMLDEAGRQKKRETLKDKKGSALDDLE